MPSTTVPPRLVARLRAICLALPETYEEPAWVGTRWMIRKRNFAHVVKIEDEWPPAYARAAGDGGPCVVLTFRAAGFLYDTLRDAGPPYFHAPWGTRWGTKVIGMVLGPKVRWSEVEMVLTESYRLLAPRTLARGVGVSPRSRAPAPAADRRPRSSRDTTTARRRAASRPRSRSAGTSLHRRERTRLPPDP